MRKDSGSRHGRRVAAGALVCIAVFGLQAATTVSSGANVIGSCLGRALTHPAQRYTDSAGVTHIVGTDQNDVLEGTGGRDVIDGRGGDDIICGRGGNDDIYGGDGNDTIEPGGGHDVIHGGLGVDAVTYEEFTHGVTLILGHKSVDAYGLPHSVVYGTVYSDDEIYGVENLTGSPFDDRLIAATDGDHRVNGLGGNDVLIGFNHPSPGKGSALDGGAGANYCALGRFSPPTACMPFSVDLRVPAN